MVRPPAGISSVVRCRRSMRPSSPVQLVSYMMMSRVLDFVVAMLRETQLSLREFGGVSALESLLAEAFALLREQELVGIALGLGVVGVILGNLFREYLSAVSALSHPVALLAGGAEPWLV